MNKYKIAIIIPYFGCWPDWIDLFFFSCHRNRILEKGTILIDWLIYTDCPLPTKTYDNVYINQISFSDFCQNISKNLGIEFKPEKAYKLCDLKPFYGVIFKEHLYKYNYTHWGLGDLDLCYGDLSLLINKKSLQKYDLITTHADRIAGHFTVMKISSKYTTMCLEITNWKQKLLDEIVLGLDELDYTNLVDPLMKYWLYLYRKYFSRLERKRNGRYYFMRFHNIIHKTFSKSKILEYYTSPLPNNNEVWTYDIANNLIKTPNNQIIPYLHFLFFKKTPFWQNPPNFWKTGFYQLNKEVFHNVKGYILFDNTKIIYQEEL